jgi:diaminopimelate decarboxylase
VIDHVHVHIGSGGDPAMWRDNIDRMLAIVERHLPAARTLTLGGGFREARMPDEQSADIDALGAYAKQQFQAFTERTGRKLRMGVEPGTHIIANAGYLITRVLDKKWSGSGGFEFVVLDAGMEANTRPLLYGSRHPFYVLSKSGRMQSSDWNLDASQAELEPRVVVGRCCESGDSQSLDDRGHIVPRRMADPEIGDYVVIGGTGAYCSAMSLYNYNSYLQAPELLFRTNGSFLPIRKIQTLDQMVANELDL